MIEVPGDDIVDHGDDNGDLSNADHDQASKKVSSRNHHDDVDMTVITLVLLMIIMMMLI